RPSEYQDRTRIASSGRLPLTTYHLPPTTPRLPPHGTPKRARPSSSSSGESTENHDRPSSPQECQSTTCSKATTSNRLWSDPPSSSSVRAAAATVGGYTAQVVWRTPLSTGTTARSVIRPASWRSVSGRTHGCSTATTTPPVSQNASDAATTPAKGPRWEGRGSGRGS